MTLFLTHSFGNLEILFTVLTWNLVSNLYCRLCRSYVNNENLSFNKYGVLSFILFIYSYTLGFYSFIYIYVFDIFYFCLVTFISFISFTKVHLFISCTKSNSFISSFISISFILQIIIQSISFTFPTFGFAHTALYFNLTVSFIFFFNQSRLRKLRVSLDKILIPNIYCTI